MPGKNKASSAPTQRSKSAGSKDLVDQALKSRWSEAISRYRKARAAETSSWDDRYEALGEIIDSDPPYYLAGGHKTVAAFLKAEVPDQDARTVRTYIRVARYFDPKDEERHGISKLDALLRYLEASGGAPLAPKKVSPDSQKIAVPKGKGLRTVPFAETSVQDLRAATRAAASRTGKQTTKVPPVVRELKALLSRAKLSEVGVRLRGDRIDLSGISVVRVAALGKALAAAKLTAEEPDRSPKKKVR